jgi:DNA modification methylase
MPVAFTGTRDILIADLTRLPGNARRGNVGEIRKSIRRHGQYRAIVVRDCAEGLVILAGNHTRDAIEAEGHESARCEVIQCSDDEARRIALADNRLAEMGGYDDAALAELLTGLDGDYEGTGWAEEDLTALLGAEDAPPAGHGDPDGTHEPPAEPVTVQGDIWALGPHRVICGDCRDFETVSKLLDGRQVNVAFTSPPYASQRAYDESSGFRPIPPDGYADWFEDVQANVRAHLAEDGSWFVNIKEHAHEGQRDLYVKDLTIAHVRRWGWMFVDELCWVDSHNGVPGGWPNRFKDAWEPVFHFATVGKIRFNALANAEHSDRTFSYSPENAKSTSGSGLLGWDSDRGEHEGLARPSNVLHLAAAAGETGGLHSAPFPVALPVWFIRAYSDPDDAVFDPFMGSGSTLIAAHQENRIAYGCEISPAYCDVIARRFQDFTGIKPERVLEDGSTEPVTFT